ncbi:DUF4011 domain-containing protein [Amaricoccus solimangrovi]|uniref:DUF4011 domain-containing protein n=1 Tax=Amaricoccus solimangrovi TaxID=2589815 RepID=UPI0015E48353|nr:DUF4011 domain-containing protein [Amaricoccus solimangrovi]
MTDAIPSSAPADDAPEHRLAVRARVRTRVNFAAAQNGVSVLRELAIVNTGEAAAEAVTLTLSASPGILREKTWRLDRVAPGGEIALGDLETPLDTTILGGLDEAEIGRLDFRVTVDGATVEASRHPIELLARDEWGGLAEQDSILAAFVSPNQPLVARLLRDASLLLERAGHSGAMEGYQSKDPLRVWMMAGAIWSAATGLGLSYAVPPASFESAGQKVRDPERIGAEGLATCLDASLLLAAAFEAAGLNTAILFAREHAWVGVWLTPRDFGRLVEPDVVAVRKAATAREFVPLETTLLTKRPSVGFEAAVAAGRDRLSEAREAEFIQAVDINRARAARVRPLASHRLREEEAGAEEESVAPAALPRPLDLGQLPGDVIDEAPTTPKGRIERWQRKLLDLSLANRLLNFRETKLAVPMICPDLPRLEDRLAGGEAFRLLALSDERALAGRDLPAEEARGIEADLAREALERGQIATPLTGREMLVRLTELYRKARADAQEGGTNTLFLAVGFLRWKRDAAEERVYRAPLLLLPVKLERRSARSEFRLSLLEDEARVNATLLELLKRDFELRLPELEGALPADGNGLDIPRILEIFRRRVRDAAGFEVVEECALSTFSFAKYLMWKDLVDRVDSLRESRLVRHLVDNPTEAFEGGGTGMPRAADIDHRLAPGDLLTPLPADSSQLSAVLAAAEGRDFVLIGPPGTGKSQTITNIIADQLGRGRTVLFVAEKAAALDVVQRRLARAGLGEAVLELHSNKADRKAVLAQLGRSWERAAGQGTREWRRATEDLRAARDRLNTYVAALHRPGSQGFSIFEAIGQATGAPAPFRLSFAGRDCHDEESWSRLRALAEEVGQRRRIVAELGEAGPLGLVAPGEWSYGWQERFLAALGALRDSLRAEHAARHALADRLGCPPGEADRPEVAEVLALLPAARLGRRDLAAAALADPEGGRAALDELAAACRDCVAQRAMLSARYSDEAILALPLDALEQEWREALGKVWPLAGLAQGKVRKRLQAHAQSGAADPERDLPALRRLARALTRIAASPLAGIPGFAGEASDPDTLAAQLDAAEAYLRLEARFAAIGAPEDWLQLLRGNLTLRDGGVLEPELRALAAAGERLRADLARFAAAGGRPGARPDRLAAELDALEAAKGHLADWMKWLAVRERAVAGGLEPLVDALEAGEPVADAALAFERAYCAWWLPLALDSEPALRGFASWEHEALIARFRELDDAMTGMAAAEAMRRLGNDLPARDSVPRNSELGTLRHQIGLQRPSVSIRNLLAQMPTTFGKLAPCVLMSPLSIAQYLPAGQACFDLVIFDEASQISTWDAIGAIARGRQAIIVGDPRQLPPTNFFGRADSDEDDPDIAEVEKDMPSILDEVAAAGIPTHRLNWHYRSRDESLIAFSNHLYYDDRLVTFPSPDATHRAVRLVPVAGTYQRGTARTNPEEARAIVAMIRARLTEWARLPEKERPTLGVITFNAQQQSLILDLLDAERKADDTLEWFFSDEREEPVIVKNLENIQGDERDVMLFSITFGPDQAGKTTMNFGALNGDGGERRLNVAVTRARAELHVFSSLGAEQIDLARTGARGVRDLRTFLDFAARGPVALAARDEGSLGGVESPFEQAVRDALADRGWEARSQIGVSGFRIDLGLRHPDHAGVWLAGVECDGARYHAAATARDRDRIRQAVLEGLGWTILRVWSTDWFRDPVRVANGLDARLREILEADRRRRAAAAEAEAGEPAQDAAPAPPEEEAVAPDAAAPDSAAEIPAPAPPRDEPAGAPEFGELRAEAGDVETEPDPPFEAGYTPRLAALVARSWRSGDP